MILELTPAMAEHARWIDAGLGRTFDNLKARKDARNRGETYVAGHIRRAR